MGTPQIRTNGIFEPYPDRGSSPRGHVRVMFIPTGGFGWVTGNRVTAPSDQSECLLVITTADQRGYVTIAVTTWGGDGA